MEEISLEEEKIAFSESIFKESISRLEFWDSIGDTHKFYEEIVSIFAWFRLSRGECHFEMTLKKKFYFLKSKRYYHELIVILKFLFLQSSSPRGNDTTIAFLYAHDDILIPFVVYLDSRSDRNFRDVFVFELLWKLINSNSMTLRSRNIIEYLSEQIISRLKFSEDKSLPFCLIFYHQYESFFSGVYNIFSRDILVLKEKYPTLFHHFQKLNFKIIIDFSEVADGYFYRNNKRISFIESEKFYFYNDVISLFPFEVIMSKTIHRKLKSGKIFLEGRNLDFFEDIVFFDKKTKKLFFQKISPENIFS